MGATSTPGFPVPTTDVGSGSHVPPVAKCATDGNPCADTGSFPSANVLLSDGSALPSWVTFTSTGSAVQTITLAPTTSSHIGTYTINVLFQTTNGADVSYSALTVTVDC